LKNWIKKKKEKSYVLRATFDFDEKKIICTYVLHIHKASKKEKNEIERFFQASVKYISASFYIFRLNMRVL
jgi:hypothetical protein